MSRLSYYLLFVLVISIFSCKNKSKEEFTVAQFTDVVQAYGPSSLSKNGSIYIDIDKSKIMELSQEIAKKAFSISPSLSGNIKIQNDHVIVFEPTDNFHSNKEYRVSLNLKNIAQLSSHDHTVFSFPTRVIPQDLSFRFKDYFIENEEWNLHVLLKLNDGESLSNMNSAIAVHQGKEKLDFNLESLDEHQYLLKIAPIDISNPNHIEVTSDSKILQMDNDRSFTFEMVDPSIFSLINTNEDIANNAISFIFSQSLNPSQNLNGLVKHVASGTTPKYKVDGNKLIIYTDAKYSDNSFSISKSLKSASGNQLSEEIVHVSGDSDLAPLLKNVGIGHIIPGSDKIVFPFEAQGLKSVQLEIFQVYSKNLQQFYQQNELRNAYNLEYVGEVVYRTSLNLADLNSGYNPLELKRYYFNLNDFIKRDKNSIYEIRLGFIPQDAYLDCASSMQYESLDESSSIFNYNY